MQFIRLNDTGTTTELNRPVHERRCGAKEKLEILGGSVRNTINLVW